MFWDKYYRFEVQPLKQKQYNKNNHHSELVLSISFIEPANDETSAISYDEM